VEAVNKVLRSGWISTGPVVREFEEEFRDFVGGGYPVAVNSATMGLMLSLAVACIGEGTQVITTPLTFAATLNAILAVGARPVFVDVDDHGNINPDLLDNMRELKGNVRGILPVHYTGAACDMQRLMAFAARHELKIIEDAAHAFGGEYVGPSQGNNVPGRRMKIGTIGDFTVFSFYANKNITCAEGGMVVAKRGEWAERIRSLSNQGMTDGAWNRYGSGPIRHYEVIHPGYKANMSDVQAAIGLTQLRRWDELKKKRSAIWNIYEDAFGWKEPGHSQHLFTIRVKNRDFFRKKLHEAGIGTGVHFNPLHLEPGFKFLGHKRGDFPNAEAIGDTTVSLPISTTMTEEDAKRVVEVAKQLREDLNAGV